MTRLTLKPTDLTPEVRALVAAYPHVGTYEPSPAATRYGAYVGDRLVAVIGWIEASDYRYVMEWYHDGSRRGKQAMAELAAIARKERVMGMVAYENRSAMRYIEQNDGREVARLFELPALAHG